MFLNVAHLTLLLSGRQGLNAGTRYFKEACPLEELARKMKANAY